MKSYTSLFFLLLLALPLAAQWSSNPNVNNAIATTAGAQHNPHGDTDGASGAIICWSDFRSGSSDIYAQHIDQNGVTSWGANGTPICSASGDQEWTAIKADGNGGAFIAWCDQRSGNYDIYLQHINSSGAASWTSNGIVVCNAANDQSAPVLELDGTGGVIIGWDDDRGSDRDVYLQRISASGTPLWTSNGINLSNVSGNQNNPHLVVDNIAGSFFIEWTDYRSGSAEVYAQRINLSGTPQWTSNGIRVSAAGGVIVTGSIISGDHLIVVWNEGPPFAATYRAQKIARNGNFLWSAGGVNVSGPTPSVYLGMIDFASDGFGGLMAVWTDNRSGINIYANRVDRHGMLRAPGGLQVTSASGTEIYPNLSTPVCSEEGLLITWQDTRSGVEDIYAARIDTNLNLPWVGNGVPVSTASNQQTQIPHTLIDAGEGIITLWRDFRSDADGDIYCSAVDCNGSIGGPLPVSLSLFEATAHDDIVALNWQTAGSSGLDHFEVQRSEDGNAFSPINFTPSMGDGAHDYEIRDDAPISGSNFYRLKMVDIDGAFTFSEVRKVDFEAKAEVIAGPNPTTDHLDVYGLDNQKNYHYLLISLEGKLIQEGQVSEGQRLQLNSVSDGTFLLRIVTERNQPVYQGKFIKNS